MGSHQDDLHIDGSRRSGRRRILYSAGALVVSALAVVQGDREVEAKSCRRHKRRCKARCDRKHQPGSLDNSFCRSGCNLSCGL